MLMEDMADITGLRTTRTTIHGVEGMATTICAMAITAEDDAMATVVVVVIMQRGVISGVVLLAGSYRWSRSRHWGKSAISGSK